MKFTKEHYNILVKKVCELNEKVCLVTEKARYDGAGLSHERFCWDMFHMTGIHIGNGKGMSSNCGIEGDYNDSHIFTATKKAISDVMAI